MPQALIQNVNIPSANIASLMNAIVDVSQSYDDPTLILSCFAVAATVSNPSIKLDKLNEIILDLSQHLVLLLSEAGTPLTTN